MLSDSAQSEPQPAPQTSLLGMARHSIIYAVGDFIAKGMSLIVLPIYTRYLDPSQYGTLELLDLVSYVAGFLVAMGVANAMTRLYQECESETECNEVISVALVSVIAASFLFLIVSHFLVEALSQAVFGNGDYATAFQIMFIGLAGTLIAEIPTTVVRLEQRAVLYVTLTLSRISLVLSLSVWMVVFRGMGVYGVLYAGCTASVLFGVALSIWLLRRIPLSCKRSRFRELFQYGLPLVGSWAGSYVMHFADRFFLQRMTSLDSIGIYSVAYKFGMMPNMLILTPFMMMWSTRQFQIAKTEGGAATIAKVFTYFLLVEIFFVLSVSLPIPQFIAILTGPEFHSAAQFVPLLMSGYILSGCFSFFQLGLLNAKRTGLLSGLVLTCAVVNIVLNSLLISRFGVWGACIATGLTFSVLALVVGGISQQYYRIPFETKRIVILICVGLLLFALGRLVEFESVWLTMVLRMVIALCFPLALLAFRFYHADERATVVALVATVRARTFVRRN